MLTQKHSTFFVSKQQNRMHSYQNNMTDLTSSCPDVKFNSVVDVSSWIERFLGKLLNTTLNTLINSNVESHHVHSASDCMHVLAKIQSTLVVVAKGISQFSQVRLHSLLYTAQRARRSLRFWWSIDAIWRENKSTQIKKLCCIKCTGKYYCLCIPWQPAPPKSPAEAARRLLLP